jgi:hypothetical protein
MTNSAYFTQKVNTYIGTISTYAALYSTVPTTSAGTELSGGSPAYARKAQTAGTATTATPSVMSYTVPAHDVASGSTVAGYGSHDAITAGNYLQGAGVTSQAFASQGTYQVTPSNSQA